MKYIPAICGIALVLACFASTAQTFHKHNRWIQAGPNISAVAAANLNDDDIPEILAANRGRLADPRDERPAQDQLSFLVAREALSYVAQPQLRTGFAPYAMVVANVDALKAPDVLVANFLATRDRDLTLFRNIGDNLFETHHFTIPDTGLRYERMKDGDGVPVFTSPGLTSLVVRDFNHDSFRDVVATGWSSDVLVYFPGQAENYFGTPIMFPAAGAPRDVAAADLDGDGHADLVTTMYASNEIVIWKGDGEGGFSEAARFLSAGRLPHKVRIADINGDGLQDLAVSHTHAYDSIVVYFGAKDQLDFPVRKEIHLGKDREAVEFDIRDLVAADVNGDERIDLAAACPADRSVVVLLNGGEQEGALVAFDKETYRYDDGRPYALNVADLDADGKTDLLVGLWDANAVAVLLGR